MSPTLTPELDYPDLARFGAGQILESNYDLVRDFAKAGEAVQDPAISAVGRSADEQIRISPIVESGTDWLTVFECSVDDADLVDSETGEIKISGVLTDLGIVRMERFDDGWKATFDEGSQVLEGVAGCFLASESEFPY